MERNQPDDGLDRGDDDHNDQRQNDNRRDVDDERVGNERAGLKDDDESQEI